MLQQYKDKVFYLQEENAKLEKTIAVGLKAEIGRLQKENERLSERYRQVVDDLRKQEH
jgi:hypothetical protein